MKHITLLGLLVICTNVFATPIIDANVRENFKCTTTAKTSPHTISLLLFFKNYLDQKQFINEHKHNTSIQITALNFMPVVVSTSTSDCDLYNTYSVDSKIKFIALNEPAGEKVEVKKVQQKLKPKTYIHHPGLDLWWKKGFNGHSGVVAIIDSGIAADHPALQSKKILSSPFTDAKVYNGIRSAHGTGVACIYAGSGTKSNYRGIAYKTPTIVSTLAGEGNKNPLDFYLTYAGLNWIFNLRLNPSVINYSFGNGEVACHNCPDWSGMAKVVDYIVNKKNILWVTSAGNNGYVRPRHEFPYTSTMTVPADSYNSLTVANMNMYKEEISFRKFSRLTHAIRYTSSRGPTRAGRKKPDITAPGNDTFTCAPNPKKYHLHYKSDMKYSSGYRLMGGTSSAAPYVGAAILLLRDAGILQPIAIKAVLINSADTWTDHEKPGPDDPTVDRNSMHHPVLGSQWNSTYGWGYINLEKAYYQRKHIVTGKLDLHQSAQEFKMHLSGTDKVTVVHERRVGFNKNGEHWHLSAIKLQLIDPVTHELLAEDDSEIDNVHQVSLCKNHQSALCFVKNNREVIVRVQLNQNYIDGSKKEPFALVYS